MGEIGRFTLLIIPLSRSYQAPPGLISGHGAREALIPALNSYARPVRRLRNRLCLLLDSLSGGGRG